MTRQAARTADAGRLRRAITGPLLFAFILGDVLGAGIYALMGVLAEEVGGLLWAPLVVALLLALLTAGSYAELVTKYPRAGGAAVFAERAFRSPLVSFLVGFAMLAAGVTSAAGLAIVFLAIVAALNARGIRESMGANLVMTLVELSGLVIVIVAVAVFATGGGGDPSRALQAPAGTGTAGAVLAGAIIAFYSFVGFETSANVVEEVRRPSRGYPAPCSPPSSLPESSTRSSGGRAPSRCRPLNWPRRAARCSRSSATWPRSPRWSCSCCCSSS